MSVLRLLSVERIFLVVSFCGRLTVRLPPAVGRKGVFESISFWTATHTWNTLIIMTGCSVEIILGAPPKYEGHVMLFTDDIML